ncbi:MAG: homoserine O-succinyltransferase [Muribaculaceae bacterium]|nr:homoserine O-succinyltransferase [Muribaculaceae bacterium]
MPIIISQQLPAVKQLLSENIHTVDPNEFDANRQPSLRVGLLNLMPLKQMTEVDFIRLLSNTPLNIRFDLIDTATHKSKNTPQHHIDAFYRHFDEIKHLNYDGFIITGAPVEKIDFEDVDYWPELTQIFDWTRTNVNATLYICWGALAGLYHHYGIPKRVFTPKISGVFRHTALHPSNPIFRGFDDEFFVPHSRFSEVTRTDVDKVPELTVMSESEESGIYMVMGRGGREFFVTGHSEYAPGTLDFEYHRDLDKGMNPQIPANYYRDDDPAKGPVVRWRSHANQLFSNWLNHFVNSQLRHESEL